VTPMREQRIEALKAMLVADPADGFALYGLALEYKAEGRLEEALPLLEHASILEEPQLYTFYQLGEVLIGLGEEDDAVSALEEGLRRCQEAGDSKAANEFAALLSTVD
jgi:tetratricopeptide (TPR) repeat protein